MTQIMKKPEKSPLVKRTSKNTLLTNIAAEIRRKYSLIKSVIDRLMEDVYTEEIFDDDGNFIRKRTHVHPQLIKWMREARMFCNDIWKLSGGEIQQEGQKKAIEIQAKIVMNAIGDDPDLYKSKLEEWKKSRSFKEE